MSQILQLRDPYRQCVLRRPIAGGHQQTTSWLPLQFADVGRRLRLKDDDGNWEGGWEVVAAGHTQDRPTSPHEQIKNHRRATGDSAPRRT